MSHDVPESWTRVTLGKLTQIAGGTTPSKAEPRFWSNGSTYWATPTDITALNPEKHTIEATKHLVSETALRETSIKLLPAGSVLMTSRATIGYPAINTVPMTTNQGFANFLPAPTYDPEFLVQWIVSKRMDLERAAGGSTFLEISKAVLKSLSIDLPPLHEQRRIAEILSSADEAIAATRAVIEQTRKVKQSTLGTLFHRGNWTDAELPAGHRLVKLEDIARRGSGHTPSKRFNEYWGGGVPWVSLQDTKALDRRHIKRTAANISDLGIKNSSAEVHPVGTVFVSRDATVGRVGVMQIPMAVSQHFISWTCGPKLDHLFLYYWLLNMKPVLERIAAGSTIKTIGLPFFKELEIALPEMATQKRIVSQMMSLDDTLDANEVSLVALTTLKSALMSDLLTGRKRVTDTLPMAAE